MEKAGAAAPQNKPSLNASSAKDLTLGKYYLVLDDLTTDVASFNLAKKTAEEIVRKYHNTLRPFSVYFASKGRGDTESPADLDALVDGIRKAAPHSGRTISAINESVTVYDAYMIDRGDREATDLGELRVASNLGLKWQNSLGSIEGGCSGGTTVVSNSSVRGGALETCDFRTNTGPIQATLQSRIAELITQNAGYVRRSLEGLREVINVAVADPGAYPKTVIFISPGFVVGRGSRADTSRVLDDLVSAAKRRRVPVYTLDIGGFASEVPQAGDSSLAFATNSQLQAPIMNAHATAWQFEKSSSLDSISSRTGGKRIKSGTDLSGSVGSVVSATGALYYLAFLSRLPADGRFHKIGVFVSSRSVRLYSRPGYYARPQSEPAPEPPGGVVDLNALAAQAEQAMKSGDFEAVARALEALKPRFSDKPDFWYNLGIAYFNVKKPPPAVEAFQQVLALSPEDRGAGLMLSRSFAAAGNTDAAAEALLLLWQRNPLDLELLIQMGRMYEADSRPARAYEIYRSALDISPNPPLDLYVALVRTSAVMMRRTEALIFLEDYRNRGGDEARLDQWKDWVNRTP